MALQIIKLTFPPPVAFAGVAALPDSEVIRRTANEVVHRPEFQLEPVRSGNVVWELFLRLLSPLIRFFASLWDISPVLAWLVIVLLVIVLIALVAHIGYAFKRALSKRTKLLEIRKMERRQSDPKLLEAEADEAAGRRDYIGAVRLLFRAALLRLAQRENREPRPGITNREYLRRYRESPVFDPLRLLVDVIDAKWYGHGVCDVQDYQQCCQAHATIRGAPEMQYAHSA